MVASVEPAHATPVSKARVPALNTAAPQVPAAVSISSRQSVVASDREPYPRFRRCH